MAGEIVAPPAIQVPPDADVARVQAAGAFEGSAAHNDTGLTSSPSTLTTSRPNPSGSALSIPHEEHPALPRTVSAMSFSSATTDTAVGCDGSPSPSAEPDRGTIFGEGIVEQPSSMEVLELAEPGSMEVSKEVTVYLGTAPVSMWMTARYEHELLCVSSSDLIKRLL